jgi:carbonic anhydrase
MEISRRSFMILGASAATLAAIPLAGATTAGAAERVSPAEALRRLKLGNTRSASGNLVAKNYSPLGSTPAKGQKPFAAILSCGDSRVVPDNIFDTAPGNLFVVRNAGNVCEDVGLGSLEFAAAALGVSLIVVLGHTHCGAVVASERSIKTGELPPTHLDAFVERIIPAIEDLPSGHSTNDSIATNASYQARKVESRSSTISGMTSTGKLGVVSGIYGLGSGRVTWLQT